MYALNDEILNFRTFKKCAIYIWVDFELQYIVHELKREQMADLKQTQESLDFKVFFQILTRNHQKLTQIQMFITH